jgi:hypothetical protein
MTNKVFDIIIEGENIDKSFFFIEKVTNQGNKGSGRISFAGF